MFATKYISKTVAAVADYKNLFTKVKFKFFQQAFTITKFCIYLKLIGKGSQANSKTQI